jgi:hypothetical protein
LVDIFAHMLARALKGSAQIKAETNGPSEAAMDYKTI